MIPTTIQELALMIYMMEINEWGVDSNEKLCTKLANESFAAAKAFFNVAEKQQEQLSGYSTGQQWKECDPKALERMARKQPKESRPRKGRVPLSQINTEASTTQPYGDAGPEDPYK